MLRSLIKSLRVVLIVVVLLTIYYAGYHLSESIFYRGRVAASYAGNNIIISNIMTTINNKFDDNFLPVSNNSSKSILSSDLHPPDRSDINIYFTVKTTPGNYAKRIRPLQISWFQKVNKEMFSIVSDPPQGNISENSKIKQFETRLIKEGFKVALSNCPIKYGRRTLCCKAGLEFGQYYQYIEKHKGNRDDWPQWFCHVDDDVYVNVEQFKKLLLHYDSLKPYYIGRHWRTEYGLTVDTKRLNQFKRIFHMKGNRRKFWHSAGPTYCLSYPLMMELKDFFNGSQRFLNTCDVTRYADDITVGAIIGVVLGYNITHTTVFDYDHIDLRNLNAKALAKMATINYKYNKETGLIWRSKINPNLRRFSKEADPPGVLSFHCLLYNDTSWCPSKINNVSTLNIPRYSSNIKFNLPK